MEENKVSTLWTMYEHARSYQSGLGLTEDVPMFVDFYEGRQWPAKTEATKDIPRPIVNITKFIVRNKKASIVGSPVSVVFTSNKRPDLALKLTEFNKIIEAEMDMDEIRNQFVQDGEVKGTGIIHFYWDNEAVGELGDYEGGVRAEVIDPLHVFFANPQERDEQKQAWILIASRVEVAAAKAMMDEAHKGDAEKVVEDDADILYTDENEQEGGKLVTVLTRYFRKDGEVYYERATKAVMLHEPKAMTPTMEPADEFWNDEVEDDGEDKLPDEPQRAADRPRKKFRLYPIVVYNYELREKSIYGIGEVEGIVPNQKALNFNLAMQLLAIQNMAWDKWIVKPGALGGQKISNAPGQVLTDHSPNGVKGIARSDPPAISNAPMAFMDTLMSMTRVVTGSTEVMTGEQTSSAQSGAAIAALQSQSLKPIQELRDRYLRSCKRGARIIKQFYELFYDGKRFEYKTEDNLVEEEFFGRDYQDTMFDISVDAGAGTPYSESLMISLLGEFLGAGYIDFSTYLELLPTQVATFKASLTKQLKEGNLAKMKQMQEELLATKEQMAQIQAYAQEMQKRMQVQGKTVAQTKKFVEEIRGLNAYIAELQSEYTAKIHQANAINQAQAAKNAELQHDAEILALGTYQDMLEKQVQEKQSLSADVP